MVTGGSGGSIDVSSTSSRGEVARDRRERHNNSDLPRGKMRLHHIGYLVPSIEGAIESFVSLGFLKHSRVVKDEERQVFISFLSDANHTLVELIQPVDERSPVFPLMVRQGPGTYHLCFSIPQSQKASTLSMLKALRFVPAGKIAPAPACENQEVGFFYSNKIGLIELLFISDT